MDSSKMRSKLFLLVASLSVITGCTHFFGQDSDSTLSNIYKPSLIVGATPVFSHPNLPGDLAPIDIRRATVELAIDTTQRKVIGSAKLWFEMQEGGYPYFDFAGKATEIKLNGRSVDLAKLRRQLDPSGTTMLTTIDELLSPQVTYTLQMQFEIPEQRWIKFDDEGAEIFFFYNDIDAKQGQGFLGRYIPANLEFDQYELDLRIEMLNSQTEHQLFTNGEVRVMNQNSWRVTLPPYFNSSALFLHLTHKPLHKLTKNVAGKAGRIPITVYSEAKAVTKAGMKTVEELIRKYQPIFGAFPHKRFILRLHGEHYGMEYAGAALSHPESIEHEFLHSWFGRYVFPATGNDGWIDEAVVLWATQGFVRDDHPTLPDELILSGPHPFNRMTPRQAYEYGPALMQELDRLAGPSGLRPLLVQFYNMAGGLVVTTKDLQAFLAMRLGDEVNDVFCRYVYGESGGCQQAVEIPEVH